MIPVTLVTGGRAAAREAAIAQAIADSLSAAPASDAPSVGVILEGLPDGTGLLENLGAQVQVSRIAPGCLCCTGNIVLRVTLNRILRRPPARLFIGLATADHLDRLRDFLTAPPYHDLLALSGDLNT